MIRRLSNWLDDRTGYRQQVHEALYENIPGGSKWRYVSGSMLVFAFVTQVITGLFLWMAYSPSSYTAWESVHFIQNEMLGGWLLRGIHHFMAQAMVVLLPVHLLQVVIDRAYKAPREINYWLGLVLMLITLALSLTGYLLPWDQKGFWATKVATNLMSLPPGGAQLQKLVVGGSDYGHHTLTRFFALHAGVLPALLVVFLAMHVSMFRKHGITAEPSARRPDQYFWPHQILKDGVACLLLLLVVLLAVVDWNPVGLLRGTVEPGQLGAELGAPADPSEEYAAARPEWYFLFLFQLLKKFHDEFLGAIVIPSAILLYLFLMPLIARIKFGHALNVAVILLLIAGAAYLTGEALYQDNFARLYTNDPARYVGEDEQAQAEFDAAFQGSQAYLDAVAQGHNEYERVQELIDYYGISRDGALALQRRDPETMGPRLFARNCASCHSYVDESGAGIVASEVSAPNLFGFGTRQWFHKFLSADPEQGITSDDVFGQTAHVEGDMVGFVQDTFGELDDELRTDREKIVAALVAEAGVPAEADFLTVAEQDGIVEEGRTLILEEYGCIDCHKYGDEGYLGSAVDLTNYGSVNWLKEFIANPAGERFYPDTNDRMPAFAEHPETPEKNTLSEMELELLAKWLRGDERHLIPAEDGHESAEPGSGGADAEGNGPGADTPADGQASGDDDAASGEEEAD